MAQDSAQSDWKKSCNRNLRRSNKQKISDEDSQLSHYKKTRNGDLWASPYDGKKWRRGHGNGHDKKKPWRD